MNDRELVSILKNSSTPAELKKELTEELWDRYSLLTHKNWNILRHQLNNSTLVLDVKEDYYSEAYVAFTKALKAIDLNKIENDEWKFLGYYRFYLKNVRAAFIRKLIKLYQNEVQFVIDENVDRELPVINMINENLSTQDPLLLLIKKEEEERCSRAVRNCLNKWNDKTKHIFKRKRDGAANNVIAEEVGVKPAAVTYYLKKIKKDLTKELEA